MPEIHIDSPMTDHERLERLYDGALFVYEPTKTTVAFCEFTSELVREAFEGLAESSWKNSMVPISS